MGSEIDRSRRDIPAPQPDPVAGARAEAIPAPGGRFGQFGATPDERGATPGPAVPGRPEGDPSGSRGTCERRPAHHHTQRELNWRPDPNSQSESAQAWRAAHEQSKNQRLDVDAGGYYTVKNGDDLSTIAARSLRDQGKSGGREAIRAEMSRIVGLNADAFPDMARNPEFLRNGWKLRIADCSNPPSGPVELPPPSQGPARRPDRPAGQYGQYGEPGDVPAGGPRRRPDVPYRSGPDVPYQGGPDVPYPSGPRGRDMPVRGARVDGGYDYPPPDYGWADRRTQPVIVYRGDDYDRYRQSQWRGDDWQSGALPPPYPGRRPIYAYPPRSYATMPGGYDNGGNPLGQILGTIATIGTAAAGIGILKNSFSGHHGWSPGYYGYQNQWGGQQPIIINNSNSLYGSQGGWQRGGWQGGDWQNGWDTPYGPSMRPRRIYYPNNQWW